MKYTKRFIDRQYQGTEPGPLLLHSTVKLVKQQVKYRQIVAQLEKVPRWKWSSKVSILHETHKQFYM